MPDWYTLLLGDGGSAAFIAECALRAVLMFMGTLALIKLTGKKEVRQFSLLELLVIIGLGSALGDPMIYSDSHSTPPIHRTLGEVCASSVRPKMLVALRALSIRSYPIALSSSAWSVVDRPGARGRAAAARPDGWAPRAA